MKSIYDEIKLFKHAELLFPVKVELGKPAIPLHVRLEPTEICNMRCGFCWWQDPVRRSTFDNLLMTGREKIPADRCVSLIDELAILGTKAVSFTGTGDPLCHKELQVILDAVIKNNMEWGITSNLALPLTDELAETLAQANWIRWSLNAGSPDTYCSVNRPKFDADRAFSIACENVARINELRISGKTSCSLSASYVVFENDRDIYNAAKLTSELGMDRIVFRPDAPASRHETEMSYSKDAVEQMARARSEFQRTGFDVDCGEVRQSDADDFPSDLLCYYSNYTAYIDARGDVYPCCYTRYDARYVIGNVLEQPFERLWVSESRLSNFRKLSMVDCPPCPHGRTNKLLGDAIEAGSITDIAEKDSIVTDHFI